MSQTLYFLRHGAAEDRDEWVGTDALRPLTTQGHRAVEVVAEALKRLELKQVTIVTSPLTRARQSAEIVARELGLGSKFEIDPRLAPGFGVQRMNEILSELRAQNEVLFVGHEPDFSRTISELMGGGRIKLKKAGLARLDAIEERPLRYELVWLISPKSLARTMDIGTHW